MTDPRPDLDLEASDFFILRTPALPFDDFERWGAGLETASLPSDDPALEAACASDRRRLRERLREILARPSFRTALFIAAPDLDAHLGSWERDPDSTRGARVEGALVRYFTRMTSRPTPFGAFAVSARGRLGPSTQLAVSPSARAHAHVRLDMDYLDALARSMVDDPDLRPRLRYRPNDTLYAAAGRLRYVRIRWQQARRTHHLVAAEPSPALRLALEHAQAGVTAGDLAERLGAALEASPAEADAFVAQLIEQQILVPELAPSVTAVDALGDFVSGLEVVAPDQASRWRALHQRLADLAREISRGPDGLRRFVTELPRPSLAVDLPYLLQVDLVGAPTPAATLGPDVIDALAAGVQCLHRLAPRGPTDELDRFRAAFVERYETETVPLAEALDPELGLGFGPADPRADSAFWLDGLRFPDPTSGRERERTARLHALWSKASSAGRSAARVVELDHEDLAALATSERAPLPDAFAVMATLAAPSAAALARGDFQLAIDYVLGPSGARLLGRFCHVDPELRAAVEGHLRREEALHPDAAFVEIVHLPEGRLGNVIARPSLRAFELPFLGRSGAPVERQLPLSDLSVSVAGDRVVLRSERLGQEVLPRLTSAHNYRLRSLPLYRFLCSLQSQGASEHALWDWGGLDAAPFLPRVTHGRVVLARARWRVRAAELRSLFDAADATRLRGVRVWREARRVPRLVHVVEADHRLLVDLENVLGLDSLFHLARTRAELTLMECFPTPDELVARGADGRYAHEILVPFVRRSAAPITPGGARPRAATATSVPVRRVFPPGREWLFAKLYTGPASADRVLMRAVKPLLEQLAAERESMRWFFLRYADPEWHLRLRLGGDSAWLREVVAPALDRHLAPLIEERAVWRVTHDTYRREVERYGGPRSIAAAERLFEADSRLALAWCSGLPGDAGLATRSRLALLGVERWLADFGLEAEARRALLGAARQGLARRLGVDRDFELSLDAAFRRQRQGLEALFEGRCDPAEAAAVEWLDRRSHEAAPALDELRALAGTGQLSAPLETIAMSHLHLHVNRVLRSAHAEQELVLYDALGRLHDSRAARARPR